MDSERIITRKAMAFDLRILINETPELDPDTVNMIIKIIDDYMDREVANEKYQQRIEE